MSKALTRKAALAQGALVSFLAPKLAQDAKINLAPVLSKITAQNFKAESAKIAQDVLSLTKGKLAKDGDLDLQDVAKVLEAVAEIVPTEEEKKPDDVTTMDDDRAEKIKAICGGKLSDEEIASLVALLGAPPAADAGPEPVKPNEPQEPNKPVGDEKLKDMVTKPAMDAAIKAAVKVAHDTAIKTQQAIFAAHREVTKAVGDLPNCAMDSVENVYASGLKALNVDISSVDPVAYRPMFQEIAKRSVESSRKPNPAVIAQDAAASDAYNKAFPNANRLSH